MDTFVPKLFPLFFAFASFGTIKSRADLESVFLPANELYENGTVVEKILYREYPLRKCFFVITFTAVRCFQQNEHRVMLIFYNNWYDMIEDIAAHRLQNGILFDKTKNKKPNGMELWKESFEYYVVLRGKEMNYFTSEFSMENGDISVKINKENVLMKQSFKNGTSWTEVLTFSTRWEHFSLFSTNSDMCPTAITKVDRSFPIWIPGRPIPVQGQKEKVPPDPATVRDVILAILFIILYYLFLVNIVLPWYFDKWFPLGEGQEG
ncbi:hypothetical protein RB195_016627 [Necator americanus]